MGEHRRKWQQERGGLDVKFNTYRGGGEITFSFLFENWKTDKFINSKGVLIYELLFSYLSCSRKGMPLLYILKQSYFICTRI